VGRLATAGTPAQLQTADTTLRFTADANVPRLLTLQSAGRPAWTNRAPEVLIDHVKIAGKSVPVAWQFNAQASHVGENKIAYVYESLSPRLRLTWEWEARAGYGPIEHKIRIENLGSQEMWAPLQDSFRFDWQIDPQQALEHIYVEKGAGTPSSEGTHRAAIQSGDKWEGTSSTYGHPGPYEPREIIPWQLVQTQGAQDGWYVGIEFSGRTHLTIEREKDSVKGEVGLNPNPAPFYTRLVANGSFETPTIFVGAFTGGADAAGNILRLWGRNVLTNQETWKNPNYPVATNNSWGSGMEINEELALHMIRDSAELGLEMFHIDAGWFRGVGDWYPNPQKFPHGLAPIADEAHKQGLKFGLWVDWTQAAFGTDPGALNARDPKVKNWMVTDLPADWEPEPFKGQTIDIGVPEAKAWAQKETNRLVTDYHLDMLEHDGYLVAQGCMRNDHPHAPPDPFNMCVHKDWGAYWVLSSNSTDVSYHAVQAYYDIHSNLRKNHPGLMLEVCNDGGRMVDFGSAAHGDYFSITDTYDPLSNRRAFYDTSHVLPAAMLESYVEKWPVPKIENFRYMLRSGMMGWLTIMQDTNAWDKQQHDVAKEEFQLYKSTLRPFIRDADLYHISPRPDGVHWDAIQYFDPRQDRGVIYAFRGTTETERNHTFVLKGLRPEGSYRLRFHDGSSPDRTMSGKELLTKGLTLDLALPLSSEIVFLESVAR
jgi:alpha-galactosidase